MITTEEILHIGVLGLLLVGFLGMCIFRLFRKEKCEKNLD
jgi:hypothetical protein